MVKHGRNKKRRAGRIGRTKLKNKSTFKRWDPSLRAADAVVRKNWNPAISPARNLANLGLLAKPNSDIKNADPTQRVEAADVNLVELFDIPDSDELREQKRRKRCPLNADDQEYIARCFSKYGDDYGKAMRDIKINKMQYTETQLRKMGARFLLLNPEQRTVEVPDKVKSLVDEQEA
ncbi:MAG: hypothetical protein SGILL_004353 [Bacillariaceae sp.]